MSRPPGGPEADEITAMIAARQINEVLHFTTRRGLVGAFAQGYVQAREHLSSDDYLEHVYQPNSNYRREAREFWRYVNLSITDVNDRFFHISRGWHASESDLFWAVLVFEPTILTHEGVLFATGNMAYPGVEPEGGSSGFRAVFADVVAAGYARYTRRSSGTTDNRPTERQAEVLYPDRVSTTYIREVRVANDLDAASAESIVCAVGHDDVGVVTVPELFSC